MSELQQDASALRKLLSVNVDAKRYFFAVAPEQSLDWLRDNGFLSHLGRPRDAALKDSQQIPELAYLTRIAPTCAERVVDVMFASDVSDEEPELLNGFLWIAQSISADQLARLLPKLRDERWPQLSAGFSSTEFGYRRMLEKLLSAKEYGGLIALATAILAIRERGDEAKPRRFFFNPFFLNHLEYTKVFKCVAAVDDAHAEAALAMATGVLRDIVNLGEPTKVPPFAIHEPFSLWNADLFQIEVSEEDQRSARDNIQDLAALAVLLIRRTIGQTCNKAEEARRIFQRYLAPLPDSQTMWKLKLLTASLRPDVFAAEFKTALFRIFDSEGSQLTLGAEYSRALAAGFAALPKRDRDEYWSQILARFAGDSTKKTTKDLGWEVLSSAYSGLTDEQRAAAQEAFGRPLNPSFTAAPAVGGVHAGWVGPKAPVTLEALAAISIPDIIGKLKADWSPARLREQDTTKDFLNPLNAEGMGRLLKADFQKRGEPYVRDAELFFDRAHLHPHYTYAFLSAITEAIKAQKHPSSADWRPVIRLFHTMVLSSRELSFERGAGDSESGDFWIAGWDAVYRAMADLVEELLKGFEDRPVIDVAQHRDQLLEVISELLRHPDPTPADDAKSDSDPFTNAINSIRGRALQALVWLLHREAATFPKDEKARVRADVKELYERTLTAETTLSVMFLFGYFLLPVYVSDADWAGTLLDRIFPIEPTKRDIYLAAWEGYLARGPSGSLFTRLESYYRRALEITSDDYTKRRYHLDLDDGIAMHLATAFIYAPEVTLDTDLLKAFWSIKNAERQTKFVSHIGYQCILHTEGERWVETSRVGTKRLRDFWDWALEHCTDVAVVAVFGYWMKPDPLLFGRKWLSLQILRTLEKTNGVIEWQHGVLAALQELARVSPSIVVQCLRLRLVEAGAADPAHSGWVYVDDELINTFRILYREPTSQEATQKLINDLLPIGNGQFWRLKEAMQS